MCGSEHHIPMAFSLHLFCIKTHYTNRCGWRQCAHFRVLLSRYSEKASFSGNSSELTNFWVKESRIWSGIVKTLTYVPDSNRRAHGDSGLTVFSDFNISMSFLDK